MKNFLSFIILCMLILAGCQKNSPSPTIEEPETRTGPIKGLELTFIASPISSTPLNIIFFLDENTGYIGGYKGVLYKSTNGGNSWIQLVTNTDVQLNDIFFFNQAEGFAVGGESGALILQTKDGGQTWKKLTFHPSARKELNSICFPTDSIGFAVGFGIILSTKDRGNSWKEIKIDSSIENLLDVKFLNDQKGLIGCSFGKLLKTTDGGKHWTISSPFPATYNHTLAMVNENTIYSAGHSLFEKSTDFGTTWSTLNLGCPDDIFKIIFTSEKVGYAFGRGQYSGGDWGHYYGSIFYTTNGGVTWEGSDKISDKGLIRSASFPTPHVGFALSGNNVIRIKPLKN